MKVAELKQMVTDDCKINLEDLAQESVRVAYLQGKYYNLHFDEKGYMNALKKELEQVELKKRLYYSGKADPKVYAEKPFQLNLTKAEVEAHITADPDIESLKKRIELSQIKLDLISDMKFALNQRNWNIRNAIEFMKMKEGYG